MFTVFYGGVGNLKSIGPIVDLAGSHRFLCVPLAGKTSEKRAMYVLLHFRKCTASPISFPMWAQPSSFQFNIGARIWHGGALPNRLPELKAGLPGFWIICVNEALKSATNRTTSTFRERARGLAGGLARLCFAVASHVEGM